MTKISNTVDGTVKIVGPEPNHYIKTVVNVKRLLWAKKKKKNSSFKRINFCKIVFLFKIKLKDNF